MRKLVPDTGSAPDSDALARALCDSGLVACCVILGGVVTEANPAFRALFPTAGTDLCLSALVVDEDRPRLADFLGELATEHPPGAATFRVGSQVGDRRHFEFRAADLPGLGRDARLLLLLDMTERVAHEDRLRALAHYDPLTDLPNRMLLQDRLKSALASAMRGRHLLALMLADLDGFKAVNDTLGHHAGDEVLRQVARRMVASVRANDTVARLGGDEFVVVLSEIRERADAGVLASRIIQAVSQPMEFDGKTMQVGASVGIALYPDDGIGIDSLVNGADAAMYLAKQAGRYRFVYADSSASEMRSTRPLTWSRELEVGVAGMDAEHVDLVQQMEKLQEAILHRGGPEGLQGELRELLGKSARHFAHEERMMRAAGYDGLAEHRMEHRRLLADVRGLVDHADRMAGTLITHYLRNWLMVHIETYDRAAGAAIRAAGVA